MNKKILSILMLGAVLIAWSHTSTSFTSAQAEQATHNETDGGDKHEEHKEGDSHEGHKEGDSHEGHKEGDGHEEHKEGDGHEGHKEGKTEITPEAAKISGIQIMQAKPATVAMTTPLTGRIVLNQNNTANIRARFPGFVRAVHVNLGDEVKKGQKLATVESNESLKTYNVNAPMNGVVLKRETNIGDVTNGKELFVIADLSTVWAKYHIFPRDINHIKKGQIVEIHTLDDKTWQTAKISMLLPTADAPSQTVIAIAELSNEKGLWRPGMTIEGDIVVDKKQASIAVPKSALQYIEGKQVVFIKNGNTYEPRDIETGMIGISNVEITSGLKHGENYVSQGSFVIKADLLKSTAAHEH